MARTHSATSARGSTRQLGLEGEAAAADALQKKGMVIIARNLRSPGGEVDLVALDRDVLVFVEVKYWPYNGLEDLGQGINKKKQQRIIQTAKFFLADHKEYSNTAIRFDVVLLRPDEPMLHLVSAFTES